MEKHTLKIYDTEATIYEFSNEVRMPETIDIEGIDDGAKDRYVRILDEREYQESSREMKSYYAFGMAKDKDIIIMAENINTKQLANLFLSLGAYRANALEYDITQIKIIDTEAKVEEVPAPKKKRSRK